MTIIDKLFELPDAPFCARLYELVTNKVITLNEFADILMRFAHNNYVDGVRRERNPGGMN